MTKINLTALNRVILTVLLFAVSLLSLVFSSCSNKNEYGIGPVKDEIKLTPVDANLSTKGKQLFDTKCGSCHRFNSRLIGPQLKDVTKRRKPAYPRTHIAQCVVLRAANGTHCTRWSQHIDRPKRFGQVKFD